MWEPGQGWPVLGQILIFQKPETPTLAPLKQSSHIVRSKMFPEEAKRLQRSRTKVDEDVEGGPEGLVLATSWSAGHFIPSVVAVIFSLLCRLLLSSGMATGTEKMLLHLIHSQKFRGEPEVLHISVLQTGCIQRT